MPNRIDETVSVESLAKVNDAMKQIREALPFLAKLTAKEVDDLLRVAEGNRAFMRETLRVTQQNTDLLPRNFDVEAFAKDVNLVETFQSIILDMSKLLEEVKNTQALAASEGYASALVAYQYLKVGNKTTSTLDDSMDSLSKRFSRKNARVNEEPK